MALDSKVAEVRKFVIPCTGEMLYACYINVGILFIASKFLKQKRFHDLHLLELVKLIFHSTKLLFMCEHAHVQCVCLRHRTDQRP